jgi:hypothetical protein
MYIEIYYWGPSSDIKTLMEQNPKLFKAAPEAYVVVLKDYSWDQFVYQVASNPKRRSGFGAKDFTEAAAVKASAEGAQTHAKVAPVVLGGGC